MSSSFTTKDQKELLQYLHAKINFYVITTQGLTLLEDTRDDVLDTGNLLLERLEMLEHNPSAIHLNQTSLKPHFRHLTKELRHFTGYVVSMYDYADRVMKIRGEQKQQWDWFVGRKVTQEFLEEYHNRLNALKNGEHALIIRSLRNSLFHEGEVLLQINVKPPTFNTASIYLNKSGLIEVMSTSNNRKKKRKEDQKEAQLKASKELIEALDDNGLPLTTFISNYLEEFSVFWDWVFAEQQKLYLTETYNLSVYYEQQLTISSYGQIGKLGSMSNEAFEKYAHSCMLDMRSHKERP